MGVVRIENGVVVQSWLDVDSLDALAAKYDLGGTEFETVDAVPGQVRQGDGSFAWPEPSAEVLRAGMVLTDLQFAMVSAATGVMTFAEAEAWVARGELPALAVAAISALPEDQQPYARIRFAGARVLARLDPFIPALQAAASLTDEQVDALFIDGAAL
ncbi:hypothetical protein V8J36_05260 [Frigidibacter sp. MR17.14]|uniref:hypothetical protein n=1 Tax=Frigidibacter sp. MR17.14 TaxID=3126509 RepID=UPI003012CB67